MRKYYMAGLFIFCICNTYAQVDPVGTFNRHVAANWKGQYVRISQYRVKGSFYFLGEAFLGTITYKSGKKLSDVPVLYDLYNQKVGSEAKDGLFEADEPVESFSILLPEKFGSQKLLFKNGSAFNGESSNNYFNVLAEGDKASLLKVYKTKLSPDPTNTLDRESKVFEQYFEYSLYTNRKQLHKIKLKEKDIATALNDDLRVSEYVKRNNLDLSKEADVVQLINKYNNNFQ